MIVRRKSAGFYKDTIFGLGYGFAGQRMTHNGGGDLVGYKSRYRPSHDHTFSAFWLRSSVVSVLISLISDTCPIGHQLIKLLFEPCVGPLACQDRCVRGLCIALTSERRGSLGTLLQTNKNPTLTLARSIFFAFRARPLG